MSQKEVTMAMRVKKPDTIHPTSCATTIPHRHTQSVHEVEKHVGVDRLIAPITLHIP